MRDRGKSFHQPRSSAQCHLHSERATPRGTRGDCGPASAQKAPVMEGGVDAGEEL